MPGIKIIVAVAENGVIGNQGKIPWRMQADIDHFQKTVANQLCVVGRKTFEGLPAKVKKASNWIVISQSGLFSDPNVVVVPSPNEALIASNRVYEAKLGAAHLFNLPSTSVFHDLFIVGGAEIYKQFLPIADELIVTRIRAFPPGDAHFSIPYDLFIQVEERPFYSTVGDTTSAKLEIYRRNRR